MYWKDSEALEHFLSVFNPVRALGHRLQTLIPELTKINAFWLLKKKKKKIAKPKKNKPFTPNQQTP